MTTDSLIKVRKSKQFKELVDTAISDMKGMTDLVKKNMTEDEARLFVQQKYLQNLQTFSDPVAGSIATLVELKTRIDVDRELNPEQDLLTDKYLKLTEEMRKTIKLVGDMKGKTINHNMIMKDDSEMKSAQFIDVEAE